ncbi:MAG TPA: ABC transporter ATP-binding protein [Syntrophales bacterium]|nr:ABC transporter ATP-binding protein [Syntrophales bacterium]HQJ29555.1 ABC transporter ATP-binding protein [Syntrophales bacterium]
MMPVLEVENLSTFFTTPRGDIRAVDDVSFQVETGDTLGIVGESGCGKTVLSLSIMRLVPMPPGRYAAGKIILNGRDLLTLPEKEMRRVRGKHISMIFQEPMTSLNPVFTIGDQLRETVRLHQGSNRREAWEKAVEMLRLVGIAAPEQRMNDYPHQLSGGMRQRVMIAIALSCRPRLMIADEPTTALDVTIQAQILGLMDELKRELGTSVILITHDLGVIAETSRRVAMMYAGQFVEYADMEAIFSRPLHPYTLGLLESIPRIEGKSGRQERLPMIPGSPPDLAQLPTGCRFQERCGDVMAVCRLREPPWQEWGQSSRYVRCWKYQ